MRKQLLLFLIAVIACFSVAAQDVIVRNDGSTVLCRIVEVNGTDVVYLKWSDLNGPRYIMDRSLISNINYQDGRQDKLNEQTSNAYAPGNQQTGEAKYNDKALLAMDMTRHKDIDTKYKKIAWGVGLPCIVVGAGVLTGTIIAGFNTGYATALEVGSVALATAGAVILPLYLVKAHKVAQQARALASAPLFQQEFTFDNGNSLCAGIDIIRDKQIRQTTLGLGLQYTF